MDARSARSGAPNEQSIPLFLDHQELCQFDDSNSLDFLKVLNQIKRQIPRETIERNVESSLRSNYCEGNAMQVVCSDVL